MIHKIYIISLIALTLIIITFYYSNQEDYRREMEKINALERKQYQYEQNLEKIRTRTEPCHIPDLNTPRSCYIDSDMKCSWNEQAKRCDRKNYYWNI